DYNALAIVCEELERGDTAFRTAVSVHTGLNSMTLMQWGTEEQKQRYLVPQAKGVRIGAFGLTEPGAGSDVAAMSTAAVRDGDHYILNGQKTWISLCDFADHFLV
ncbi:acyl-CoA dehydrogenase family protein, partial [Lysinibacillus fusiformis]|uniref:acyl-CoA dehydrogenase family protein n=1 Tax=Lysinibacillus fusiformis TaxID=28031 RepID=UPI00201C7C4E